MQNDETQIFPYSCDIAVFREHPLVEAWDLLPTSLYIQQNESDRPMEWDPNRGCPQPEQRIWQGLSVALLPLLLKKMKGI